MPRLKKKDTKSENFLTESEVEFVKIKKAIAENLEILTSILKRRFKKYKDWKLFGVDISLPEENSKIDLVLEQEGDENSKYLLIEISIPSLGIGQKYTLDSKAKFFKKTFNIQANRIKKAILLIKKANEQVVLSTKKLNVPIFELPYESVLDLIENNKDNLSENVKATVNEIRENQEKDISNNEETVNSSIINENEQLTVNSNIVEQPLDTEQISKDLVEQLKESIVHEALSTIHKRKNKYIRRGLWKWLERDILDPNVHFFLIILSCIYQGKSGDVLSKYFKTVDHFTKHPNEVIEKIFSQETCLAPEILQSAERHKKALQKFLECFVTTPPFEYLRSLFQKEFRATRDSLKSRIAVFDTLKELLTRCGFVGEKEVQYPLEILDELGIFQGFLAGNYKTLRVENAIKKLQQLVPYKTWTPQDVYKIRDEVAKLLSLPPNEFNLNAFLPQSFGNTSPIKINQYVSVQKQNQQENVILATDKFSNQVTSNQVPVEISKQNADIKAAELIDSIEANNQNQLLQDQKSIASVGQTSTTVEIKEAEKSNSSYLTESVESITNNASPSKLNNAQHNQVVQPSQTIQKTQASYKLQYKELDESKHRFFEYFGGHIEEDLDAIYLALEMVKFENNLKNNNQLDHEALVKNKEVSNNQNGANKELDLIEDEIEFMPKKKNLVKEPQHNIRLTHHSELLELSEQILSKKLPPRKKKLKLKRLRELLLEQTRYNID